MDKAKEDRMKANEAKLCDDCNKNNRAYLHPYCESCINKDGQKHLYD